MKQDGSLVNRGDPPVLHPLRCRAWARKNAACRTNLLLHILKQNFSFLRHFEMVPDIFKKRGGGQCSQGRTCFHRETPQA